MSEPPKDSNPASGTPAAAPSSGKAAVFRARTLSTVLLWALVAAALWKGDGRIIGGMVILFGTAACWEYLAMLRADRLISRSLSIGTLIIGAGHLVTVTLVCLHDGGPAGFWVDSLTLCGAIVLSLSAVVLAFPLEERTLRELAATILGILYIPVLFAYAGRIYFIGHLPDVEASGIALLLYLILVTKTTDMGAYVVGTLIGKHKMIPRVSPGKTWEGFAGAVVITILMSATIVLVAGEHLAPLTLVDALIIGLILALFSVMGDLAASALKRCLGAKDSGHSLPGIGGILDLIDSLLFTAPILYLYLLFALKL